MSLQVKFPFGRNHGPLHTCRDCGFATKERYLFERHTKRCPRSQASNPIPGSANQKELPAPPVCRNYKCRKCEFTTSKAKQFLYHLKGVHKENINIYPCDLCEYAAKHKSKVIRHRTLVHKGVLSVDQSAGEMDTSSSQVVVSDAEEVEEEQMAKHQQVFVYQSASGPCSEVVFPGGGVPPPMPHPVMEQNIPAPADAAEYMGPRTYEEVDEDFDEEEEDISGLEMDGEDPEISFRVMTPDTGIELPERSRRPLVASDLPHNPHPTEDAYNYIEPVSGVEEGLLFKCKICTYKNPHKWKIANHIRTIHMKRKLFKCPYCDFVCERKIEWCVHKTSHTKKTVYSCKECLYRTTMKRNFDRHLNRHLTRGPYKCGICTYSSTGEAAIQRHMAEYHLDLSKENDSPVQSVNSSPSAGGTSDRLTPDVQDDGDNLPMETSPTTPKTATSPCLSDVMCRICGLSFRSESKLRIHMVAHSSIAPWGCPECPLRYKRPADLNRHMKRKHGRRLREIRPDVDLDEQDEPLNLTVVKDEPLSEQDMPLDLSVNSSPGSDGYSHQAPSSPDINKACKALTFKPETLKCSHCSYQAKWPSDLRRHMLVHSIEKRFRCQFCNKRYKYQFDLNMHIRKTHRVSAGRTRVSNGGLPAAKSTLTPEQQLELEWSSMMDADPTDGLPTMVPQRRAWEMPTSPSATSSITSSPVSQNRQSWNTNYNTPVKLKCDYCPYIGKYRAEVERHMRLHTGNKPYTCLFCEYKSFWKGDMKRHLAKHHNKEVSEHGDLHELVNATYSPSSDVESSAVATRWETDRRDGEEEEEDNDDLLLDESIVKVEPLDADENPIYEQLEENNNNNNKLPYSSYGTIAETMVPIENMSFESCEVEQPDAKPGDKKVFKCPLCSFVCEAPSKLKCHYEIHGNLKRYMCPSCGKRSNWLWDVRKHIRKDHPSASMDVTELTEEEATATLEDYLNTHRSPNKTPRETPTRELPPAVDPVALSADVSALLEKRMHSREVSPAMSTLSTTSSKSAGRYRPYKCSDCGRRSNWKWDLNKHIRTSSHPDAKVIIMDEEEARTTFEEEVVTRRAQETEALKPPKPLAPISLQPVDIAKLSADRCRPYKCSKCGRRSNWKWDMSKHIRSNHPTASLIILNEEEARLTIDEYLKEQQHAQQELQRKLHTERLKHKQQPGGATTVDNAEDEDEDVDMEVDEDYDDEEEETDSSELRAALLQPAVSNPGLHHHVDIQRLKRFKCSACPYRSNFRSDIGRHIKRKHIDQFAKVVQLGYNEAATTLKQYRETFAKKKFVPSPSKSGSSGSLQSTPETSPVKAENVFPVEELPKQKTGTPDERNKLWRCSKCDYKDKNKMRVVKHFKKHAKGMAFLCKVCGDTSDYRTSMYRHIRSKHQRQDFDKVVVLTAVQLVPKAEDGEEMAMDSSEINNNNTNSGSSGNIAGYVWKNYKCGLCKSTSIYKGTIVRHIREKHKIEDALPLVQTEETMSMTPPRQGAGEEAYNMGLTCDICPFQTNKEGLLKMHKSYHKAQPGNKYKCKYCPYYVCATRMLHQHTRLHLKELGLTASDDELLTVSVPSRGSAPSTPDSKSSNRARHFCDRCPYVSINRNDYLYHKQFHRPKPTAPFKCDLCPYWVSQRRLLTQHQKVHQPGYREHYSKGSNPTSASNSAYTTPTASPCKSVTSDNSETIQVAHLKQRIIAGKITSVPITPEKLAPKGHSSQDDMTMPGYIVNRNGVLMSSGAYRKLHKCTSCPYTNVRLHNLRLHEKMHGYRKGNLVKCQFCDYYVGNKGLLAHHIKVHSQQYRPGHDVIMDFELEKENKAANGGEGGEEEDPGSEPEEENNNVVVAKDLKPSFRPDPATQLSATSLPNKSSYYIKYDDRTGEHILERAILKKWCCEKCPYATMKRAQFERHSMLHSSNQKYTCEYCNYSVPGYHLLLQHKKLHMLPNPNLLSVQSISNLQSLPEVPADIAAAANFPAEEDETSLALHDHMTLYENTTHFSEPKKLYRCDRCPYTNVRRDHLLAHLKFHMIRNELTCLYCDYSVSKVHLLNQHIKVHFNTPGGEMNAQSEVEGSSSPSSKDVDQPEFIDISELVSKIKNEDAADMEGSKDKNKNKDKDKDKGKDKEATETGTGKAGEEPMEEDPVEEDKEEATHESLKGEHSGVQRRELRRRDASAAEQKTEKTGKAAEKSHKKEDKVAKDSSKAVDGDGKSGDRDWVCQYCDRSFSASDKLLRHEMQHLVGNKF